MSSLQFKSNKAISGMMTPSEETDVHFETDIRTLGINSSGFAEGDWIPYLYIKYQVQKKASNTVIKGKYFGQHRVRLHWCAPLV